MAEKYVVRVMLSAPEDEAMALVWRDALCRLLESFRYAGVLRMRSEASSQLIVFDLHAPAGIARAEIEGWARRNAARMRSFGLSATPVLAGAPLASA